MHKIDAHQHFWKFDPIRDAWIDDTMQVIRRDFLPQDLQPVLHDNGIDGCVAIQADQSEVETEFLLDLADNHAFIKGVVGWVDLLAEDVEARLAHYSEYDFFKGVRHIAQAESNDFLMREDVQNGISHLEPLNLTYDILIYQQQLPAAIALVNQFPQQKFVLDHIAKPQISKGMDARWKSGITELAMCPNVFCKISGMVTETDQFKWETPDFIPFLEVIFNVFGANRVLYGSDWPVCLLAAEYQVQKNIVKEFIRSFSSEEQDQIMGKNAIEFYDLKIEE